MREEAGIFVWRTKFSLYVNFIYLCIMVVGKKATVELIDESERVSLYSISFERLLTRCLEDGSVRIEKKSLMGIEGSSFLIE